MKESSRDLKLAVIGAGSTYTPELVEGVIRRFDDLPVRTLALMDIDEERLRIVGGLAERMVGASGKPVGVVLTSDRSAAISGADFVVTQMRVGGMRARILDEKIPLELGVIGQETTGPGGFSNALRTIPVVLDLCRQADETGAGRVGDQLRQSVRSGDAGRAEARAREGHRAVQRADWDHAPHRGDTRMRAGAIVARLLRAESSELDQASDSRRRGQDGRCDRRTLQGRRRSRRGDCSRSRHDYHARI